MLVAAWFAAVAVDLSLDCERMVRWMALVVVVAVVAVVVVLLGLAGRNHTLADTMKSRTR